MLFIISPQSPKNKFQAIVIGDLCEARRPITTISDKNPQQGYGWLLLLAVGNVDSVHT